MTFTDIADGGGLAMPSYVLKGNIATDAATRIRFAKNGDGAAADGGSGAFSIDMSDDEFRLAHEKEAISFSSAWANGTGVKVSVVKPDGGIETLVNESGAAAGVASWAKPAAMGLYELRHESGGETLTAKFAVVDGIVHDGTIADGETWGKGNVHIVGNNLKVADGATLTIEPGAVVKFLDGKTLTIESGGACVAEGVVFTSIHDDTAGGDSFNDGGATAPSTNGYAIVGFVRDDLATEYRYGVQSYAGTLAGEVTWRKERTYVIDGTLAVATNGVLTIPAGTVVKFTEGSRIRVATGGVCMAEGAVFTHIADDAVGGDTMGDGDATVPEYGKYTVDVAVLDSDETEYRYSAPIVTSGTLNGSNVWRARQVYHVTGNLTLASGATLTIAPGSVVKFNPNTSLTVNSGAILNAQGTRSSPIVFTSVKDDVHGGDTNGDGDATVPNPGDWARVVVKGTVRMDNCVLMYGSASGGGNVNEGTDDLISILGGTAIFTNGRMSQMMGYAVGLNSGKFHMTNSVIEEAFCAFRHWPSEPVVNSVIYNCNRLSNNNGQVLYNCIIVGVNEAWDWSSGNGNTYKNCVFWNEPDFGLQTLPVSASPQNGNIWADPKFADPKNGDFRIAADSPCVDAGDATIAPAKDRFGQPRYEIRGLTPTGTPNADGVYADIGIYELQPRDAGSDVDLEAVAVAMPESLTVGEKVLVTWRVANVGSARASGEWEDKLELVSPNGVVELGTVKIRKIVEPACEYVVSHEFTVPSLSEGTCSVRLRANCNSGIGEGSLVANNIRLSDSQSAIALSTKAAGAFSVSVPSRQTTSFRLGDDVSSFFVSDSKGILDVSMRVVDSETGHMRIVAGVAVAGGVVLSLPSDMPSIQSAIVTIVNGSSVAQTVACEASSTKCAVLEYTPERIGNKAKSVVSLAGYGMDYVANVKLSGNGVDVPCSVLSRSTGGMTVDVDGVGCKAGTYALAIELADGNMLPVGNVEMFSNGTGPRFEAELDIPSATRYGRLYSGRVIYRNSGDEDMTAPVLVLSASGADIGFAGVANASARIEFVALGTSSPHGVLKAGEVGWIEFKFKAGNAPRFSLDMLDGDNASWIEEKRKISEAATVLNGRGRRVFILEDILDYAKHSVSNSHAVCGKVIVNDGRTKNVTVVAETAEGEMVGTDIADANGVFVIDGLASASNYVLRIVSGASGGSSEIHMPEIGDLTGVCLEAMGLRTLHFSLAGIPTEEVVAGNLVVSDEYGEVLGTCRLDDGYVDYSSSNMVDMVFIEAKLDSGRMVRTCELVSPYDELLGMVTEIDFSEARLLKGKVCDGDGRGFAGARVRLRNVDFSVVKEVSTDDDGAYAIGGLEVGLYIVDAFTSSSSAEPLNVEVIPGADSVLDFTLSDKPTVCVSVSVSNVEGGAELVVEMGGMIVSRHEVDNALVSINDVPEGEYDFYLVNSDGILVSDVVSRMVAGTSVSLSLSMLQAVNCYGRICDTTGKGIVGFCEIKPFRGRPWRVYSDEEGVLEFSIPQGRYWMQCGAPGFCDRAFHAAVGNDIEFTIRLNDFADVVDEEIGVDSDDFVHDEDVSDTITFAGSFYSSGEINLEFLDEGFEVLDDARLVGPSGQWRVETVPSECAYVWATDNTGLGILRTRKNFENGTVVFDTHDASLADVQFEVYADSEHATPLADVTVRLTGSVSNTLVCTTDHSGRVRFRVSPDEYHVDFGRTCIDVMSIGTIVIGTGESRTIQLCYSAANGSGYATLSPIGGGKSFSVAKPKVRLASVNLNELAVKFGMNVRQFAGDSWSFIKVVSPASMSGRISKAVSGVAYYSSSLSGNYVLDEPSYKCEHNMDTWDENKIAKMEYDFYLMQARYDAELSRLALLRFYVNLADTVLGYNPEYAIGSTAGSLLNVLISKFQQGKVDAANKLNGIQSDLDELYIRDESLARQIAEEEDKAMNFLKNDDYVRSKIEGIEFEYGKNPKTYPKDVYAKWYAYKAETSKFKELMTASANKHADLLKQRKALAVNINKLTKDLGKIANKIGNVKLVRQGGKWVKWAFIAYDFNNLRQLAGEADRAVASMSDNVSKTASAHMRLMDSWKKGYHDSCGSDNFDNNSVTNITDGSASTFNSEDPNEMVGPAGVGDSRYVKPGDWMDYTIYFENMTNATAAAQDIYVTLPKDAGLDWSTFELGEVVFGDNIDTMLSGFYEGESSYAIPDTNWSVRTVVTHAADAVKWHLRIIDPTTPDNYPTDAYAGFLPPNDETGRGEGHLRFRVKVKDGAVVGSRINASATIVFDYNDPITTDPEWWNTVGQEVSITINDGEGGGAAQLFVGAPYGDALSERPAKDKPGYTFGGWYTGPDGTGRRVTAQSLVEVGDGTLYAHWLAYAYNVHFDANGGEGQMSDQPFEFDKEAELDANAFEFKGYSFGGWATNETGEAVYADCAVVSNLTAESGGVVNLYATWTVNSYTVAFDANGGEGGWSSNMVYGTAIAAPTVTHEGYTFAGWQPALLGTVPASDVTFTAQWTVNSYTVAFDANGGEGGWSSNMVYGTAIAAPTVTREGYTFAGWQPALLGTVPASNVTFTAQWNINQYTVNIDLGGGTGDTGATLAYGMHVGDIKLPTKVGYAFDGWWTAAEGGEQIPGDTLITGELSLYARWIANAYMVRFNANGGTGTMADQAFVYGTAQKLSVNAFKQGMYAFVGWATKPDGEVVYADGQLVENLTASANGVVTLFAVWTMDRPMLFTDVTEAAPQTAASVYDGYLYNKSTGALAGTIQVKVGKPGKDGKAAVKATVVGLDGKKKSLKAVEKGKATIESDGTTTVELVGGDACEVKIGAKGMSGTYGSYDIDGALNVFTSKDAASGRAW